MRRLRGTFWSPDAKVLESAAEARHRFDLDASPDALGNLSLSYLLMGDPDRAVEFAALRVAEAESVEALVDLSAAQLEQAMTGGQEERFATAFDSALRALRREPHRTEALFNRALAVEGMGLAWMAREAWDEYLRVDSASPWADAARSARARAVSREADNDRATRDRLAILAAWQAEAIESVMEIAQRRPDLARELMRREALPAVARAVLDHRSVERSVAVAQEVDAAAQIGDRDTLDREALIQLVGGDRELAAAHVEFARASQALDERDVETGSPGVLHALSVFARKKSPYAAQAELQAALIDFFRARRDGLVPRYTRLLARLGRRSYPLLKARALWMRGLCHRFVGSDKWAAYLDTQEAHRLLAVAGQRDQARQVAVQLAAALKDLGRDYDAQKVLQEVALTHSVDDSPLRTLAFVQTFADHLAELGLKSAALELRIRAARENGRASATVRAHAAIAVAELANQMSDSVTTKRALESAAGFLRAVEDREIRAELEILRALALLDSRSRAGAQSADEVDDLIATLRVRRNDLNLTKALTLAGERRRTEGEVDAGEAAFREALAIQIASRARTRGEFEQIKQFESAERPADDLIDLLSSTGRLDEAFDLIERVRSPGEAAGAVRSRSVVRPAPGEAVVSYWLLTDRVLVTVITASGTHWVTVPTPRLVVAKTVQRVKGAISLDSEPLAASALSDLHRALIAPLLASLGPIRKLTIVPDRELWEVPFPGLVATPDSSPLASRFEIAFSPSVSELGRPRPPWKRPQSVLAVGGPAWDRVRFKDLAPLPASTAEAREVAALYAHGRVLTGREATRSAIFRWAPSADVIHVATHAVASDRDPGESFLLLAPEGPDSGTWRASDSGWASFSRAQLVVLSACGTGSQRSRFGGASLGVLRSLRLATRAPVLVSTGDVDDAASRRLQESFHRFLLADQEPAAALRRAQMESYAGRSGMTWMLYRIVI